MVNRRDGQFARWLIGSMVDRSDSERLRGFCNRLTDRQTDICNSRVAFATENDGSMIDYVYGSEPFKI